jgi:Transglutaminase-like superfamily
LESNRNDDTEAASSYFLLEFKRRFKLDATIARYIQDMSSVLDSTDLGPDLRRNSYASVRQDDWKRLNKALVDSIMENNLTQALDGLRRMTVSTESTRTRGEWTHGRLPTRLEACLACQIMDTLYFAHVQYQWNRLLEDPSHEPPDKLLREGAVLLAKLCRSYDALTHLNNLSNLDEAVETAVTMHAEALSVRLQSEHATAAAAADAATGVGDPEQRWCGWTAVHAAQCLLRLLRQAGRLFGHTHSRFDMANSSVNAVMLKRSGNPLTLVLILQWILQKVNVESSLIELPRHQLGHVLLGVTERTGRVCYFNVFLPSDEPLTEREYRSLVVDLAWPMTPIAILTRMLRDIQDSARHWLARYSRARKVSVRRELVYKRSQLLLDAMTLGRTIENSSYKVEPLRLDPLLFRQYGANYVFR